MGNSTGFGRAVASSTLWCCSTPMIHCNSSTIFGIAFIVPDDTASSLWVWALLAMKNLNYMLEVSAVLTLYYQSWRSWLKSVTVFEASFKEREYGVSGWFSTLFIDCIRDVIRFSVSCLSFGSQLSSVIVLETGCEREYYAEQSLWFLSISVKANLNIVSECMAIFTFCYPSLRSRLNSRTSLETHLAK